MRVVLVAGGSGGHIYPALELARYLKLNNHEVFFVGSKSRMEANIIPNHGYDFFGIDAAAIAGSFSTKINSVFMMYDAYTDSKEYLKKIKPDCVIGFGSYITVPVLLAAKRLKLKTVIHEANSIVGKANSLLSKFVDKCIVSYPSSIDKFPKEKTVCLGNPRGSAFKEVVEDRNVLKEYGLSPKLKTVLIFMGSQGSKVINDFMLEALKGFRDKKYQVIYITGNDYYQEFTSKFNETKNVKVIAYGDTLKLLPNVDCLISRAGATSIAEITALGLASILIPSPYVPLNHQYYNAMDLVEKNAACIIEEDSLTVENLISMVDDLLDNDEFREQICKNAKSLGKTDSCELILDYINQLMGDEHGTVW